MSLDLDCDDFLIELVDDHKLFIFGDTLEVNLEENIAPSQRTYIDRSNISSIDIKVNIIRLMSHINSDNIHEYFNLVRAHLFSIKSFDQNEINSFSLMHTPFLTSRIEINYFQMIANKQDVINLNSYWNSTIVIMISIILRAIEYYQSLLIAGNIQSTEKIIINDNCPSSTSFLIPISKKIKHVRKI